MQSLVVMCVLFSFEDGWFFSFFYFYPLATNGVDGTINRSNAAPPRAIVCPIHQQI